MTHRRRTPFPHFNVDCIWGDSGGCEINARFRASGATSLFNFEIEGKGVDKLSSSVVYDAGVFFADTGIKGKSQGNVPKCIPSPFRPSRSTAQSSLIGKAVDGVN